MGGCSDLRESTFDVELDEQTRQMVGGEGVISGEAGYIRILSSRLNTKRKYTASSIAVRSSLSSSDLSARLSSSSGIDRPEKQSSNLYVTCGPEFLECIESAQRLGSRLFKPALLVPNPSLLIHHVG